MKPTTRLRFVEREETTTIDGELVVLRKLRVLQQWWKDEPDALLPHYGEWRDVPLEVEE